MFVVGLGTALCNGAMNYFDTVVGNGILSVHYQIGGGQKMGDL